MVDDPLTPKLHRQAIDAAIKCQWNEAIELNLQLIEIEPENAECLNRLAKAYFETGNYSQAKKIYQDVLKIDPYNSIAQKNLKRVSNIKKENGNGLGISTTSNLLLSPSLFIEEPGTTKSVTLIKVAEPQKLLTLSAGQMVNLNPKNRGVTLTDSLNQYLGVLPDDTAHHLLKLLKGGNKYQAIIKSVKPNSITIMIRETHRSKKFKNQASFLDDSKILAFSSDNISLNTDSPPEDDSGDERIADDMVS